MEQIKNLFHHGQAASRRIWFGGATARRYRDAGGTLVTTVVDATAITRDVAAQFGLARA
ncbi:MAG TPA: hypothetical protein VGY96_07740 [Streptosporangiaceae bacterium]|nr:hypothetical protein [Streptosporangiaceae bacterium]